MSSPFPPSVYLHTAKAFAPPNLPVSHSRLPSYVCHSLFSFFPFFDMPFDACSPCRRSEGACHAYQMRSVIDGPAVGPLIEAQVGERRCSGRRNMVAAPWSREETRFAVTAVL